MNKVVLKVLICSFMLVLVSAIYAGKSSSIETYNFDPHHSYVQWKVGQFGFASHSGKWMIEKGKVILDENNLQNSTVNATINLKNIITGIPGFGDFLQGLFNTGKFPTATFVSNKVSVTGEDTAIIYGTLTLRGISKSITLNVKLSKRERNTINKKQALHFTAKTTLKRSDFDIKTLMPGISNEVRIYIEVIAINP